MNISLSLSAVLLASASSLHAAQFSISADINGPLDGSGSLSTWSGTNPNQGFVGDGGFDALDGYGYLQNLGVLTVQRQVDALLTQNTYRWLDIFTNPTGATVTQTVRFVGDLGSDGNTVTRSTSPGLRVTSDNGGTGRDPVLAHVSGFTSFTGGSSASSIGNVINTGPGVDDYILNITLTLAPGQSAGILNFLALARENPATAGNFNSDIALATTMGQNLLTNPIFTGLTTAQIGTIRNFATPEPGTLALLFVGLTGLALAAYRRRSLTA